MWRDEKIKVDIPDSSRVISVSELDEYEWYNSAWEWEIDFKILKLVIEDEKWDYYKIVKQEYDFLLKHGLPLPRNHWIDRMKLNLKI
jgi:hypothetical protein